MLKPAGDKLAVELANISLSEFKCPVVTNVTAKYIDDTSAIKDLLIRQVSSPVLWEESVRTMLSEGVDTFVEIGPGKALSGFIKKISKEARVFNVEDMDSLKKTLDEM
jgi:[acyl-carrier-protein] S-malonyltransferase